MMLVSLPEQQLCIQLRDLPEKFKYRYTDEAHRELLELLFRSLAGPSELLPYFFPHGPPTSSTEPWSLRNAQGAVEGAEYTPAARGKPCGHIFKSGEATYRCKTCTVDDTCVLCARCFDASDHEGHTVYVSISPGNSGCCDCGDEEAWVRPVHCNIHSELAGASSKAAGKSKEGSMLPDELLESIRMTIARALDYVIDVFSCSPEQLRLGKTEQSILEDERLSRLNSKWYVGGDKPLAEPEFALVLWNDEKHTVHDVRDQVARACKQRKAFGLAKAVEVDDIGRTTVVYSTDVRSLLRQAKVIEEIKLTVTIRSSRDTFREQMCATIVEWISDISGCSVGADNRILRYTICEELLKPWRVGSEASHQQIGQDGIDDHEIEENDDDMGFIHQYIHAQRRAVARAQRRQRDDDDDETTNDSDEDEDDEGDGESAGEDGEDMEIDNIIAQAQAASTEMDIDPYESPDEALEVSEATIAGYPPPPPPPPQARSRQEQTHTPADSDGEPSYHVQTVQVEPSMQVPRTPRAKRRSVRPPRPPKYWLEKPEGYGKRPGIPPHEDLWQRLRLDYLILYDLRMWKKMRIDVRDVFISTVVTIPEFKRLLGLRFAGVYTALAQLYLIADREPDHSIINLSLQMLTTPSITAEVVERGNFLTILMAILYTFLTSRQVGFPWEMNPKATLAFEAGAVTNRRMYHFFLDMKYLLSSEHVQEKIREEERYLLQFLDLVKLHQGICPNVRAVGEHLEYETDAWISASLITREINKLCRQFSEAYTWKSDHDPVSICKAIRCAARVAIVNSLGAERKRFDQAELKTETRYKSLDVFEFDAEPSSFIGPNYKIVDFVVAREPMSFHHALHYTLSWLIDRARGMSRDHLLGLLLFSHQELKEPYPPQGAMIVENQPDEYLLALFDFPLRVCAWLAQMRAGMWVRNGITLRHQMSTYRGVGQRDVSYQRDIFLLQTAFVVCSPSVFLASMVDRFGLLGWMTGNYQSHQDQQGIEDSQMVDVVEDFVHLLIILLSDRTSLIPAEDEEIPQIVSMRRDIAHILCFKPLSFSELTARLSDKVQDTDEFSDVLSEMSKFRPPEGLSDTGTFELKEQYLDLVDPYILQYTRNQREEAENVYKNYMAKKTGKQASDIVFEPKLRPIRSGVFKDLSSFTRTPLFTQIIYYLLAYALVAGTVTPGIAITRVEGYVQFVLQLILVSVLEDNSSGNEPAPSPSESFVASALKRTASIGIAGQPTILSLLNTLSGMEAFKSCEPKIKLIIHRMKQRQPQEFITASEVLHISPDRLDTASPASITLQEKELKKKQALERQARVMASFKEQQGKFMANQDFDWGEDFSDLEEEAEVPAAEQEKVVKYPSGTCILCQEETDDQRLYGTFAYISQSSILRLTDIQDQDWVGEVAATPPSLDRSADGVRPFGVSGRNRRMVEKVTSEGKVVTSWRQDLGKGFPCDQSRRGPVTTGCGHIMHHHCFDVYIQATQRRHVNQIARNHPERPELKEFLCPLCKALGNAFLPIIWKGKTVSYPGVLGSETSFDDWIGSRVAIDVSRFDKRPEGSSTESAASIDRQQKTLLEYSNKDIITPLASRLADLMKSSNYVTLPPTVPQSSTSHRFQVPAFLPVPHEDPRDPVILPSENNTALLQNSSMAELVKTYIRLRDTLKNNGLETSFIYPPAPSTINEDLTYTDTLAKALGYSIAAVEIAQRGIESDSPRATLLDKISPQSLTHLRVFSETVSSYIAIGGLRNQGSTKTNQEHLDSQYKQLHQLFIGHPNMFDPDTLPYDLKGIDPLLVQDPFIFLSECAVGVVPALHLDISHVLRLCYLAEMVRVVAAFFIDDPRDIFGVAGESPTRAINPQGHWTHLDGFMDSAKAKGTDEQFNAMSFFVERIINTVCFPTYSSPAATENTSSFRLPLGLDGTKVLLFIQTMMASYALPFLRKAAILMHVRYGVEPPNVSLDKSEDSELHRLCAVLKLPTPPELLLSFAADTAGARATRSVVYGWLRHWAWHREGKQPFLPTIRLSHPAIFELVGLPKNYDTLTDEAIRRKCPTTGKELTDPCVCLFCGEILCSQGVCCMKDKNKGGCWQHQAKCGGNIGLFINIRKCMVLFMNMSAGTWAVAPYLDKHGEADPTLRRHHQLFLNQKRYDVLLRQVWLNHGVPSMIARRLEGDVNNGGWETL